LPSIASGTYCGDKSRVFRVTSGCGFFDFFFVPPYLTFRISIQIFAELYSFYFDIHNNKFTCKIRKAGAESSRHREKFNILSVFFFRAIMAAEGLGDILDRAVNSISEAFESDVVIFLPGTSGKFRCCCAGIKKISL